VANTFADSVTTLDVGAFRVERTIKLGPQSELSAAQRGEQYFYDARLSLDGWFSCHSCHTDGHSNGLTSDNFGDGAAGAPKRIPSLLGSVETGPWAWDGHVSLMEDQIRSSLVRTMRSPNPTDARVAGLAEFVRSLSAPPRPENVKPDDSLARQGEQIFARTGCTDCHRPPTYTSPASYDVGIVDELGRDRFNPPSLRGVRLRPALFHDNRAGSLEDVLLRHRHGQASESPAEDVRALLAFLRGL
jgi:cytochrome c peroxidase